LKILEKLRAASPNSEFTWFL